MYLQNGYAKWVGGYLDTNGHSTLTNAKYGVYTAATPTRGEKTGTWEILSATGKAVGQPILSGDVIYLHNLYGGDGGYLDTNSHASAEQLRSGGKYDVSTSAAKDRYAGTGRWRIYAQTSTPADSGAVHIGDVILLWNLYADNGGFLEVNCNSAVAGAVYEVCTNAYFNRADDVANWKILAAP